MLLIGRNYLPFVEPYELVSGPMLYLMRHSDDYVQRHRACVVNSAIWVILMGKKILLVDDDDSLRDSLAEQLEPWQAARLQFLPGITGVWQLDRLRRWRLEEMISADLLYVLRWSPRLDLEVLLATLLGRSSP